MNIEIDSRELFMLDGLGVPVRGTYHRPHEYISDLQRDSDQQKRIGIVFLNSLFLPRTATGDSAVYWAESFAACGYPSFRIDLPGLGDSDAPLNTALLDFINAGGYESVISAKVKELVERFCLSGVILVGHCAGAVSAIYGAAACGECKGLVLMDPYFYLPQQLKQSTFWKRLVRWASKSASGRILSDMYDRLKGVRQALRGSAPPANANHALLKRWKDVTARRMPILLLKAPGRKTSTTKPRVGEFDYLKHILELADRRSEVVVQFVDGTDHSFANSTGRVAVRQLGEHMLRTHFPISHCDESNLNAPQSLAKESDIRRDNKVPCGSL
jgi:pimeloyl-ACP methyl ester carboxylesterase